MTVELEDLPPPGKHIIKLLSDKAHDSTPEAHNHVRLDSIYRSADRLHKVAQQMVKAGQTNRAFCMLQKFLYFVVEKVPSHAAYHTPQYQSQRNQFRRLASAALDECEKLKQVIVAEADKARDEARERRQQALSEEQERRDKTSVHEPPQEVLDALNFCSVDSDVPSAPSLPDSPQNPEPELQRQHSSQWDNLRIPTSGAIRNQAQSQPQASVSNAQSDAIMPQLRQRVPTPPPRAPPVTTVEPQSSHSQHPNHSHNHSGKHTCVPALMSTAKQPEKRWAAVDGVKPVFVPTDLMRKFMALAHRHTRAEIEFCGILTGNLINNGTAFSVTTVIIPDQKANPNQVETFNEDEMIDIQIRDDLLTLGWIHTHPTQACFLSSIDCHTQYTYQVMMDEAIAIVCAPTVTPNHGVFNITTNGMKTLAKCSSRGFHHHKETGLFQVAPHARWFSKQDDFETRFVDLRKTKDIITM